MFKSSSYHNNISLFLFTSLAAHILFIIFLGAAKHIGSDDLKMSANIKKISLNFYQQEVSAKPIQKKIKKIDKSSPKSLLVSNQTKSQPPIPQIDNSQISGVRNPPSYPKRSLMLGQEGVVTLRALIDAKGSVLNIKIIKSSGYSLLDNSAKQAVVKWKFKPFYVDNKASMAWVEIPVQFVLG